MGDLSALRLQYRSDKATLMNRLGVQGTSTRGVRSALQKLSRLTDQTLRELWTRSGFGPTFSLIAVGGYGRGELFPYSDVDVLVLLPDGSEPDQDEALKSRLESFIGACWDVGLEIGSSVRTTADCVAEASKDVTVQTSLLECRLICGSKSQFTTLVNQLNEAMDPKAFFVAKTLEMRQRHNKFENTPYSLEPNCKESPGGLRDLQIVLWVAKAAGLGRSWDELARKGLATSLEARQIKANEALLNLIRARLHLLANRREDRLVFDLQNAVAESFGFKPHHPAVITPSGPGPHAAPVVRGMRRASEVLMKRYYWAAKAVTQLNQILLLNIEERLASDDLGVDRMRPINERFFDKAGMLEVASDNLYVQHPHAILETFHIYQTTVGIKGLSARTLRALYNARPVMNAKFRNDPVNRATFMQILMEPEGITHAMRLMNQTSVLGRYLWVFRHIVGQMQHDLFHVYTVDQHILMVLRNVRRFFIADHSHEYPFCSQLAAGWDKPWIFYIAALFHDIAKGRGG
ncbi:MAG: nucleotidyltransferase domain-containing protein, partial [Hydrogenophaga sp.]|nr:nucleotidyltransferase domain-containing protein [Hydrogenophaga sp.]